VGLKGGNEVNVAKPDGRRVRRWWRVHGQGLVEYAMIMVMIAIVIILILTFIGQVVAGSMYSKISSGFPQLP
jgi:Flp pilus assembly pilin Flp